jgi:hypothetical protein
MLHLVEAACFFSFFCFFIEAQDFIDYFNVGKQHASATVPFYAQAVEDVACVLACFDSPCELVPLVSNQFAAGETSYWDNQFSFFTPYL